MNSRKSTACRSCNEHETFYTLIVGLISLIRLHPDIDDDIVRQVAAQTLHLDEYL